MRELVVHLPVPAVDSVDHLREGEHRRVAGRPDGEDGYDDEDGLKHLDILHEEIHVEVDEDEGFAQLREDAEKVFVVLESNAAEQEGYDAGYVQGG